MNLTAIALPTTGATATPSIALSPGAMAFAALFDVGDGTVGVSAPTLATGDAAANGRQGGAIVGNGVPAAATDGALDDNWLATMLGGTAPLVAPPKAIDRLMPPTVQRMSRGTPSPAGAEAIAASVTDVGDRTTADSSPPLGLTNDAAAVGEQQDDAVTDDEPPIVAPDMVLGAGWLATTPGSAPVETADDGVRSTARPESRDARAPASLNLATANTVDTGDSEAPVAPRKGRDGSPAPANIPSDRGDVVPGVPTPISAATSPPVRTKAVADGPSVDVAPIAPLSRTITAVPSVTPAVQDLRPADRTLAATKIGPLATIVRSADAPTRTGVEPSAAAPLPTPFAASPAAVTTDGVGNTVSRPLAAAAMVPADPAALAPTAFRAERSIPLASGLEQRTGPASASASPLPPAASPPSAGAVAPAGKVFAAAIHAAGRLQPDPVCSDDASPAAALAGLPPVTAAAATGGNADPSLDMRHGNWPGAMIDHIEKLRDAADAVDSRIRVVPDALGGIDVSLRRHDDGVQVTLRADQPATQAILADARPQLTAMAEARGIRLADAGPIPGAPGGMGGAAQGGMGGDPATAQGRRQPPSFVPSAPAPARTIPDPSDPADGRVA